MKRNPSIEVFRCLLMFLIVLGHCWKHGIWQDSTEWWTLLFSTALIWHVDGFVAISGWFGIKFSWNKFFKLWGLCAFYTALSVLYAVFCDRSLFNLKTIVIGGGWFTGAYIMLMMVAPIVNAGLEKLKAESPRALICAWAVFAVAMTANWAPLHAMSAIGVESAGAYTFANLLFVYVTARCARLLELDKLPLRRMVLGPCVFVLGVLFCGGSVQLYRVAHGLPFRASDFNFLSSYNAPHVWLMAVGMLLIFARYVKVPEWIGRVASFCSPSMFSIYLMSDTTCFRTLLYRAPEMWLSEWGPMGAIIASALSIFTLGLLVDFARRGVLFIARRKFN